MGSPYLNSDEAIILSTHNIIVNTVPSEAILTSQRLILVDSSHTRFQPRDIPFAAIATVMTGETAIGDPSISLSITTRSGATQPMEIGFLKQPRTPRTGERDDWVTKLKEQIALLPPEAFKNVIYPSDLEAGAHPEETVTDTRIPAVPSAGKPVVPPTKGSKRKIPFSSRFASSSASPSRSYAVNTVTAIIIVILVIAIGIVLSSDYLTGKPGGSSVPVAIPAITPSATIQPTPSLQQTPTMTPTEVSPTTPQVIIPQTGVWIRVLCAGNFSGSVGTSGRLRQVTGSGDYIYQIPAKDGIVEASIQKQDNSGDALAVEVYNNGMLVKRSATTTPKGLIELHVDLVMIQSPAITPSVTPSTTITPSIPM